MRSVVCLAMLCSITACAAPLENTDSQIDAFKQSMQVWDFDAEFGPVYFGSIRDFNDPADVDSCLALAFMKVEGDRVHYIHKLWPPENGECDFGNVTAKVDGLQKPSCFSDDPSTEGTRAMTPTALGIAKTPGNYYRQLDLKGMQAGQLEECADASWMINLATRLGIPAVRVVSVAFGSESFEMHTNPVPTVEWLYTINLDYVDVFDDNVGYPKGQPK